MDWRRAYLRQAKSDFELLQLLTGETAAGRCGRCHVLHYLQMTFEKLAKGYSSPATGPEPAHTHKGAVQLVQLLIPSHPTNSGLHQAMQMSYPRRRAYLMSLLPIVEMIERLAPSVARGGINPEYPWQATSSSDVVAPIDHNFNVPELRADKISRVMKFLQTMFSFLQSSGEL